MIVRWPGRIPAGLGDRCHGHEHTDLFPTVLQLLGIDPALGPHHSMAKASCGTLVKRLAQP